LAAAIASDRSANIDTRIAFTFWGARVSDRISESVRTSSRGVIESLTPPVAS
jgi:hypothetical protein